MGDGGKKTGWIMTLVLKLKKIKKYPPSLLFQILLDRVTFHTVRLNRFYLLAYAGLPDVPISRGPGFVRKGEPEDADEMETLENAGKKALFRERFLAGEQCAVAVHNHRIIGYEWYSSKPFHKEQRYLYTIPIANDALYVYDAFIKQEYRISGIWVKLKKYIGERMRARSRTRLITLIDSDNKLSLNTHVRFGFRMFKNVVVLSVGGMRFFMERHLDGDGKRAPGPDMNGIPFNPERPPFAKGRCGGVADTKIRD